jgi:hypothetical protein
VIPKNAADRRRNLTGRKNGSRDLVKQRLKHVVIGTVDQIYFRGRLSQCFGGCQSCEAPADDDDFRYCYLFIENRSNRNASRLLLFCWARHEISCCSVYLVFVTATTTKSILTAKDGVGLLR